MVCLPKQMKCVRCSWCTVNTSLVFHICVPIRLTSKCQPVRLSLRVFPSLWDLLCHCHLEVPVNECAPGSRSGPETNGNWCGYTPGPEPPHDLTGALVREPWFQSRIYLLLLTRVTCLIRHTRSGFFSFPASFPLSHTDAAWEHLTNKIILCKSSCPNLHRGNPK